MRELRRRRTRPLWSRTALALLTVLATTGLAREPVESRAVEEAAAAESAETRVDEARVAEWIEELGADSFKTREAAKRELVAAGVDAIGPIVKAANEKNLEVAVRALRIFETMLARVEEDDEVELVEDALDQLLTSPNPATATRAEAMAEGLEGLREKRAMAKLESLGAQIEVNEDNIVVIQGQAIQSSITITLEPDTWKGGDEAIKYVTRVRRLNRIYLVDDVVSEETRTELAAQMPNVDIQGRGKAYLGVGGAMLAAGNGCFVQTVKPGTAAEKAGIEPGDVIQKFAGEPVPGFAELVDLIKAQKPGDTVVTEVLRNGVDTVKLEVKLGRWADNDTKPVIKGARPVFPPIVPQPVPDPLPNKPQP